MQYSLHVLQYPQVHQVRVMLRYMQAVLYIQSNDVYSTQILDTQKRIGLQCVRKK